MGNHTSSQKKASKARSDMIDRQLEEDFKRLRRECKVLFLGSRDSGKSAIIRQMIIHETGSTEKEHTTYQSTIYRTMLDSAKGIIFAMQRAGLDCVEPINRIHADRILNYHIDPSPNSVFPPDIADAIHELWKDPIVPEVMEHSSELHLVENVSYFLTHAQRIGSPDYQPTEDDILQVQLQSTGIMETRFTVMNSLQAHILDLCEQHWRRQKLFRCFDCVTSIVFCVSLCEYNEVLLEDKSQTQMAETIIFFDSIVNSIWFRSTSIVLLFTDIGAFKTKLSVFPLDNYFPEYSGGVDINKATKFILMKFMEKNRARLSVYPHFAEAADTTNARLIFVAVRETILHRAMRTPEAL